MTSDGERRPSRAMWVAWGLALLGGLTVLLAVGLALLDPCLRERAAIAAQGCGATSSLQLVTALAGIGTAVAVVGGITATVLALRRRR